MSTAPRIPSPNHRYIVGHVRRNGVHPAIQTASRAGRNRHGYHHRTQDSTGTLSPLLIIQTKVVS